MLTNISGYRACCYAELAVCLLLQAIFHAIKW